MAILRILGAALMAALLPSGAASAQSYGFAFPGLRSGEPMAAAVAYVGDREGASYPYVIYAVSRSRPEGYFWVQFRFDCSRAASEGPSSSSHGFIRWEDRVQTVGESNNLLAVTMNGALLARRMSCANYGGDPAAGTVQGRGAALRTLRSWQSGSDPWAAASR
ncbi:hypothetical protein [Brevundimonas sp. FT23042]|uniref:hypothetical protein n=1 Tax=Brevundimonas sp. FT23042 TaxID=3393749 RepID=UPI003B5861D7